MSDSPHRTSVFVDLTINATEGDVRRALGHVVARLKTVTSSDDAISSVELVLAEAMNNVVEHAYKDQADGQINLLCEQTPNGMRLTLTDSGLPVPDEVLLPRNRKPLTGDIDALPEGGFGWFLILDLAHDVQLQRVDNKTVLHILIETD